LRSSQRKKNQKKPHQTPKKRTFAASFISPLVLRRQTASGGFTLFPAIAEHHTPVPPSARGLPRPGQGAAALGQPHGPEAEPGAARNSGSCTPGRRPYRRGGFAPAPPADHRALSSAGARGAPGEGSREEATSPAVATGINRGPSPSSRAAPSAT